jgi:DNA-binding CsgD family transcriptional regulator
LKFIVNQPVRIASLLLIGIGALLLGLNIFMRGALNIALPLVFLMLGGAFFILIFATHQKWRWIAIFYIPATLLLSLGVIFLINTLTNDWNAWAYAWLLLLAGLGFGLALTNRDLAWHPSFTILGVCFSAGGVVLFAIFGAIVGGLFIQVMAPILLILGGVWLYWLRPETILPGAVLRRLRPAHNVAVPAVDENAPLTAPPAAAETPAPSIEPLVEALSARELEVLRMVDAGLTNQQIASRLMIAPSTVKTHINNLYGKLAVQTRVQAIHRARELGLLP